MLLLLLLLLLLPPLPASLEDATVSLLLDTTDNADDPAVVEWSLTAELAAYDSCDRTRSPSTIAG